MRRCFLGEARFLDDGDRLLGGDGRRRGKSRSGISRVWLRRRCGWVGYLFVLAPTQKKRHDTCWASLRHTSDTLRCMWSLPPRASSQTLSTHAWMHRTGCASDSVRANDTHTPPFFLGGGAHCTTRVAVVVAIRLTLHRITHVSNESLQFAPTPPHNPPLSRTLHFTESRDRSRGNPSFRARRRARKKTCETRPCQSSSCGHRDARTTRSRADPCETSSPQSDAPWP